MGLLYATLLLGLPHCEPCFLGAASTGLPGGLHAVDGCWELGMSSPLVRLLTGCFGPVSERCLTPLQLIQVNSTQAVRRRLSSSECPPTKAMICACMRDGCACITSTSVNGFLKEGFRY